MHYATRSVRLQGARKSGEHAACAALGPLMSQLPHAVRQASLVRLLGRSSVKGRPPSWVKQVEDVRCSRYGEDHDDTVLEFEMPTLGTAAEALYLQGELWDTRPSPEATGFDLFAESLADVTGCDQAGLGGAGLDGPVVGEHFLTATSTSSRACSATCIGDRHGHLQALRQGAANRCTQHSGGAIRR